MGRRLLYASGAMKAYPIKFPEEMLERLRAASKEQDRPIATIVRRAVEVALRTECPDTPDKTHRKRGAK